MFKQIIDRGRAFAENTLSRWVTNSRLPARLDIKEAGDARALSGIVGIGAGGLIKTAGYVGLGFTGILALTNPVTALGAAGYAAATLLFGGTALFGKGMEKGGDNLSGLITFRREVQKGMVTAVREDFRSWRKKKAGADFSKVSPPSSAETNHDPKKPQTPGGPKC